MTNVERRPGSHQGGDDADPDKSTPEDTAPGRLADPEVLFEVGRLVAPIITAAHRQHGRIYGVDTKEWWDADDGTKLAGVVILALAWLVADPQQAAADALKAAAVEISEGEDWPKIARCHVAPAELLRRRAALGPMTRTVDRVAAQCWAATGSSRGVSAT